MKRVHQLALKIKALEQQIETCTRCGGCQAVCPVYQQTHHEADVARGKIALLQGLAQEIFKNADYVQERLRRCLLCGACGQYCPRGVNGMDLFIQARSIIAEFKHLPLIKKTFLRYVLATPKRFDVFIEWLAKGQAMVYHPANANIGTSCAKLSFPLADKFTKDRHVRLLAATSFKDIPYKSLNAPAPHAPRVALFIGCLIDKMFPHIAQAALDILVYHELTVSVPPNQCCCGIPALSMGDRAAFEKMVFNNLVAFTENHVDYILTACATCTNTLKNVVPLLMASKSRQTKSKIADFSNKVMDISQFLVLTLGLKNLPISDITTDSDQPKKRLTYHDPCHLKKSLGIYEAPRILLRANKRYSLIEMEGADQCCGMGGSFNLDYYPLSMKIGHRKLENIQRVQAEVVATTCPACMFQLSDILSQANYPATVKHALEIFAEGMS